MPKKHKSISSILIDLGSSTVKAYEVTNDFVPSLLASKSINFKNDFDPEVGISQEPKEELFTFLKTLKNLHPNKNFKIFATSIYRKMSNSAQKELRDELFSELGVYLNIVEHSLENFYLEKALVGKYDLNDSVLLVNIGGGSTELVVMKEGEALDKFNIEVGVGTILSKFSDINEDPPGCDFEELRSFIGELLPKKIKGKPTIAFYSGGELTFMKLADYPLKKNDIFEDKSHPSMILTADFVEKNKQLFYKITISELEKLMPKNPKWMHGARACSLLAETIFTRFGIQKIIPSDANLIHGAVRQEFRAVTISGSFRKHLNQILKIKKQLEKKSIKVLSPRFEEPKNPGEEFVVFSGEEGMSPLELERHHLDSIDSSDALIVCNPGGYVGASALIEIGYANAQGKKIMFMEKPEEFMLKTLPAEYSIY